MYVLMKKLLCIICGYFKFDIIDEYSKFYRCYFKILNILFYVYKYVF